MIISRPDVYLKQRTPNKIRRVLGSINLKNYRSLKDQIKLLIDYKNKTGQKNLESIREIAFLGRGGFGSVFKAEYMSIKVAVKKSLKDKASINELEMLKSLSDCPNIVSLYDNFEVRKKNKLSEIWQIMELCEPGDIHHAIKLLNRSLSGLELRTVILDVLNALIYLHEHEIVHCDIKGLNMLLSCDGKVKLCDFGSAVNLRWSKAKKQANEKKFVSDKWMAPELLSANNVTKKCDIWSFGISLIELYCGKIPFSNLSSTLAMGTIVGLSDCSRESQLTQLGLNPSNVPEAFIACLLEPCADKRPTAKALLGHPFLQGRPSRVKLKCLARNLIDLRAHT